MELFRRSSHIAGGNATYVEDLYESYLLDPNGVPEQWRDYFDKLPRVESKTSLIEDVRTARARAFCAHQQDARAHGGHGRPRQPGHAARAQAGAGRGADLRLPAARPPEGQPRPARACRARARGGPRAGLPRALDRRSRYHVPGRQPAHRHASDATLKEIIDALEAHLLPHGGRRVHAHRRHGAAPLDHERMESVRSAPDYGSGRISARCCAA
jgi:2-oxoglutarate dehydrogenase E1 component